MTTQQLITSGQQKQYIRFVEDAAERALAELGLDKDGVQRVIERGDEFQSAIKNAAYSALQKLSVSNRFKDEEIDSSYTYPKEYEGPKPIEEQINVLATIFNLDPSHTLEFAQNLPEFKYFVPEDALPWVGWFAVPSVNALANKHFRNVSLSDQKYCQVVQFVLWKIAASRSFDNYHEGQINPHHLRACVHTEHAFNQITMMQKGDILIIAAQLGMYHRGRSARRAREVFAANEFGLGSVAVGSIILTHPEREIHWSQLHMDCAGEEFDGAAIGDFSCVPSFRFDGGNVEFGVNSCDRASRRYASVTAFLPRIWLMRS